MPVIILCGMEDFSFAQKNFQITFDDVVFGKGGEATLQDEDP